MEWLLQNWIWIVFAVGLLLLMRRGGMACGMGRGRSHGDDTQAHQHPGDAPQAPDRGPKDSVSSAIVNSATALHSMYQGRMYYFASPENRDAFEASPSRYAGHVGEPNEEHRHHHHRHGC
jgi:YHS domain-containing protein